MVEIVPSVKTRKKKDIDVIMEIDLNEEKDKIVNSCPLPLSKRKRKRGEEGKRGRCRGFWISFSRERVFSFSLDFYAIQPSAVFGIRRKTALRGEGFVWVPDLRSLDKLLGVGVSPYLVFILCLRAMLMFELNEVVRGRLIGPKSWD